MIVLEKSTYFEFVKNKFILLFLMRLFYSIILDVDRYVTRVFHARRDFSKWFHMKPMIQKVR